MKIACCLVVLAATLPLSAAEPTTAAAPGVKKTVEAFSGAWEMKTTMRLPGAQPATFAEKVVCRQAALGRAVTCVDTFTPPGMGANEYAYLIGYDAETDVVHLFSIGSPGEVHDHHCKWKGDETLECEPLQATMDGSPVTEVVSLGFSRNQLTLKATTTTKDGPVVVEGTGRRVGN
jgi:hypothetical protein